MCESKQDTSKSTFYLLHREVYWSRMLLEIHYYGGTRRLLVIVLQFLGLNHHLAVTSTKFPQNPELKQRHNCSLLTIIPLCEI